MSEPFKLTRIPSLKTVEDFRNHCASLGIDLPCEDTIVSGNSPLAEPVPGLTVNGKRVNIASYKVKVGDVIEIKESSKQLAFVLEANQLAERELCPGSVALERINAAGGTIKDSMGVDPNEYLPAAKLGVTKSIPVYEITPGSANTPPGSKVTYKEVGTSLEVTPRIAGANVPAGTQLLFGETDASHAFVLEEGRLVPAADELEKFYSDVQALVLRLDRLDARMTRHTQHSN